MKNFVSVWLALFVMASASAQNSAPIKVSVTQLFEHPQKYNGKQVDVTGYWVTSCAHCSDLYPSFESEQKRPYGTFVPIGDLRRAKMPFFFRARLTSAWGNYDGYMHVVGTFQYRRIQIRPVKRHPEFVSITQGFGWMGIHDKWITDVTEFRPIGHPIPSNIEKYDEDQTRKGLEETEKVRRAGELAPSLPN